MIERIGNCRIIEEVGAGGMAVVYKAIQEPLGRTVGIKALKSSIAVETQFAERFEREAKFMASLQQENIINVYDFIKYGGTMFIVMEYVEGIDLYDLLDNFKKLPVEVATIITLQVARALNHAHFRGIIHRDIKPANVMISKRGDVKLMDFGIARDETLSDLTETGTGLGTPSYMSPEQILGDKLDQRTDIWSLGVVFYQMLSGKKPFIEDAKRSVLQKIRLDRFVPVRKLNSRVPRVLERILGRCMEKQPADRYPSMQSLIHDLEDFLASRVVMNYNAYMVKYLQEQDVLSSDEASGILTTGAVRDGQKIVREDRRAVRTIGMVQGVVLAFFLFAGIIIQLASGEPSFTAEKTMVSTNPKDMGELKIVADPWAKVVIDNEEVALTPIAKPLTLPAGKHFVELINPYFKPKRLEVEIKAQQTVRIVEELALDNDQNDNKKKSSK
ncbi:MAG: serine/threonine protein kinase [Deltaproteobacteria bacterium]|nr:serine/threonine protein kinase [Deltaproteobacteria bacterium]MBN2673359.1 serine/threonine protein kinase [Deltaproteobacteria bacterium]